MTASHVTIIADAIHAQVLGGRKLADQVREAVTDIATPTLIAECLTAARRETASKLERIVKIEANKGNATDNLKKSHLNAWAYASKIASELAGVKFVYSRKAGGFLVEELKAANETTPTTAAGKDNADPMATSEAIQVNSQAADAYTIADAIDAVSFHVKKASKLDDFDLAAVMGAMISAGISLADLTGAIQAIAHDTAIANQLAADKATADLAADQPKAPKILAEKLVNKPAQKKRTKKVA